MTWMTPLLAMMSALTTLAPLTMTPCVASTLRLAASTVLTCSVLPARSALVTLPGTTWYVRICVTLALFSGFSRLSSVPAGRAAKAASVGAKTVNGPGPLSVSTRPAAWTALTNVPNWPAATAVSTTSLVAAWAEPAVMPAARAAAVAILFTVGAPAPRGAALGCAARQMSPRHRRSSDLFLLNLRADDDPREDGQRKNDILRRALFFSQYWTCLAHHGYITRL